MTQEASVLSAFLQTMAQPPDEPRLPKAGDRVIIRPKEGELTIELRSGDASSGADFVTRVNGEKQSRRSRWLTLGVGAKEQLSPNGVMMLISACTGLAYREHTPMTREMACYELVAAPPHTTT